MGIDACAMRIPRHAEVSSGQGLKLAQLSGKTAELATLLSVPVSGFTNLSPGDEKKTHRVAGVSFLFPVTCERIT